MFCEKCGKPIEEGAKFCVGCGAMVAPVTPKPTPAAPTPTPIPTKSLKETLAPAIDSAKKGLKAASEKVASLIKDKKPSKKSIILGAVALVLVVAIIVTATIVLPIINAVKIQEYIEVELEGEQQIVNGHINAAVVVDVKQIRKDKDPDISRKDYTEEVSELLSFCELEIVAGDNKISPAAVSLIKNTSENNSEYYDENELDLSNLSKDDVIKVNISWSDDEDDLEDIEDCEEDLGFKFNKDEVNVEFKVSDLAKEQDLDIIDTIDFDFFAEFEKHIEEVGCVKDEIELSLENFDGEIKGTEYRYVYDTFGNELAFYDKDEEQVASFNVYWYEDEDDYPHSGLKYYDFSEGDKVKFTIESYDSKDGRIGETHVYFKDTEFKHIVKGNEPLTAKTAKANAAQLKKDALAAAKQEGEESYSSAAEYMKSVSKMYFISSKEDKNKNYILIFTKNNEEGETTYSSVRFENPYYDKNSNFKYSYHYENYSTEKYKDSFEYIQNYYFEPEDYKYTEIK